MSTPIQPSKLIPPTTYSFVTIQTQTDGNGNVTGVTSSVNPPWYEFIRNFVANAISGIVDYTEIQDVSPKVILGNPTSSPTIITEIPLANSLTFNLAGDLAIANTAVTAGSYGSSTEVPTYTVNSEGRLTHAANVTISGTAPGGTAGGDLTGSYPNPTVVAVNGVVLSSLGTGIVKNTTGTGHFSIAIASDFPTLNQNTSGNAATASTASACSGNSATATNLQPGGAGTSGYVYTSNGVSPPSFQPSATGSGTVTSVTFTGDGTVLSSTPSSAVTTSGTVTGTLKTQAINTVLAGPSSGSSATPTFRSLVLADIPLIAPVVSNILAASAVNLPTNTSTNLTSISVPLGTGKWLVSGNIVFVSNTGIISFMQAWVNTVSATPPDQSLVYQYPGSTTSNNSCAVAPAQIITVAGTTTIYLSTFTTVSATCKMCGIITASPVY